MAAKRDRPFSQFNFIVQIGNNNGLGTDAGFQEVSGLTVEVHIAEYRAGNFLENTPLKMHGSHKVGDVTLKRGVVGDKVLLHDWIDATRQGKYDSTTLLTVIVNLLSEDRQTTVQSWKLLNARPMKYTGPSLTGKGTDVAIEELVLSCETIEFVF